MFKFLSNATVALVLLSASPGLTLAQNPTATAEIELDTSLPKYDQVTPVVAGNGKTWLVVWSSTDIYGALLDSNGKPCSAQAFPIATGPSKQFLPRLTRLGNGWLAVWAEQIARETQLKGTFIGQDGRVENPDGFLIGKTKADLRDIAVETAGPRCLVVWEEGDNTHVGRSTLTGALVTKNRRISRDTGISIRNAPGDVQKMQLSSNGSRWYLVWHLDQNETNSDTLGTVIDFSGRVQDRNGYKLEGSKGDSWSPSVASNGRDWLVLWSNSNFGVAGHLVTNKGIIGKRLQLTPGSPNGSYDGISISARKGRWLVAWLRRGFNDEETIEGVMLNESGKTLSRNSIRFGNAPRNSYPDVFRTESGWGVVWGALQRPVDEETAPPEDPAFLRTISVNGELSASPLKLDNFAFRPVVGPFIGDAVPLLQAKEKDGSSRVFFSRLQN